MNFDPINQCDFQTKAEAIKKHGLLVCNKYRVKQCETRLSLKKTVNRARDNSFDFIKADQRDETKSSKSRGGVCFRFTKQSFNKTHQAGFTLIELLMVVSILAVVSGIGFFALSSDTLDEKYADLAKVEMQVIAKAVKQFKIDTGYYPGQGPFALLDRAVSPYNCYVPLTGVAPFAISGDVEQSRGAVAPAVIVVASEAIDETDRKLDLWHKSPINMRQLLVAPVLCAEHPLAHLAKWDESTGKGWHGPYISREGYVDISCTLSADNGQYRGLNGEFDEDVVAMGGSCDLNGSSVGTANILSNIPAIADPFSSKNTRISERGGLLDWRSKPVSSAVSTINPKNHPELGRIGQPYLLFFTKQFTDGAGSPLVTPHLVPRLVSAGPDGKYGGVDGFNNSAVSYGNAPSQDAWCIPNTGSSASPTLSVEKLKEATDDIVLCF